MSSDPTVRIDPQLAAALRKNKEIGASLPPPDGIAGMRANSAKVRKVWNEGGPQVAEVREDAVPGPLRDIPVVIYRPSKKENPPALIFQHGGGWKNGNQWSHDRQLREIATAWGGVCISTDYAHVPEHRFPAAHDETAVLYRWLAATENGARWGIDSKRLAFVGVSAGANNLIGTAATIGAVKAGYLKAGVSIVGGLDDDFETPSMKEIGDKIPPTRSDWMQCVRDYTQTAANQADPRFNNPKVDPAALPPMYFAAAELDPLRDCSTNMAAAMAAAGRPHTLKVYAGMTHTFFAYTSVVDRAAECVRDVAAFLAQHVPAH